MDNCIFCKIVNGKIPSQKIYEDAHVFAFLDIKPISKGHTLVIPKKHSENIIGMQEEDAKYCIAAIKKIAPSIMKAMNADGFNIGMNNFPASGQIVMHSHFHIIPRFNNDGMKTWPNKDATPKELEDVQKKIADSVKKI